MYEALLERSLQGVDAVKRQVLFSDGIRSLLQQQVACLSPGDACFDVSKLYRNVPESTQWKIFDHCSVVTRLYAVYEQFVREILTEYLSFLEASTRYTLLDESLQIEHQKRLGRILTNLDRPRYQSLTFESIIGDLKKAFNKRGKYRLLPEAMLSHEQNLRLTDLAALCSRCGIRTVPEWIEGHPSVIAFFEAEARQSDRAEAQLRQLVEYRNDAAHGGFKVDDVLGVETLGEYADFLSALFVAFADCVRWAMLERYVSLKAARAIGKVSHVYSRNIATVNVKRCTLSVGDEVYFKGEKYCYRGKIVSIQENNVSLQSKRTVKEIQLGFQFDTKPRLNADIYLLR